MPEAKTFAEPDMMLPDGKTCSDCEFFKHCEHLFRCPPESRSCDWSPSRFSLRA